ncbi:MAG: hypothetical protein K2L11_02045 [Muribaculaceae bacterium]|nr:hypothetical protein [Muribaculaceae bacterium]
MTKKIILFLLLLIVIPVVKAQSVPEVPDTVKIIENADKVIVSRSDDTTLIEVQTHNDFEKDVFSYSITVDDSVSSESDDSFDFEIPFGIGKDSRPTSPSKRLQTSYFVMGNVYLGHRFNYSDKGNVKNSFEAGVRNLIGIRWSHGEYTPSFSIGLGYGVQRYSAQKGFRYVKEGSSLLLVPAGEGAEISSTDLQVFNFQIPLLFTIPIGRDVEFVAGAVGCFNTYARASSELKIDSSKYKTTYKGLQQRLFTAELTASIGVCDILGVYASWSPMTLFQSHYGPQLKSWSIGATINF